ncbi:MAG: protein adenylyltransferase SelO family protein, partial [Nitrosospira sp.]
FHNAWRETLADKLGLVSLGHEGDDMLLSDLFDLMQQVETDMTLFFRGLMTVPIDAAADHADNPDHKDDGALAGLLRSAFYTEQAFKPAQLGRLTGWLRRYIARVRLDAEAADGVNAEEFASLRLERMKRANPKYVLRNYMAQQAIDALEQGDASVITRLMEVLKHPYDEQPGQEELAQRRPEWARNKAGCSALSCSS